MKEKVNQLLYRVAKPERYTGNEWNIIKKDWTRNRIKILLSFPDVYEIGMSHLGLKILYHLLNNHQDLLCERTYAPWFDMEELMRDNNIQLFSLESGHVVKDFDIFAFTLQYEMSYTNIVNMLDLADIPLYSRERDEKYPLVIGGGSTVYNPEPVAPFFDLLFIGEAEENIEELVRKYGQYRQENYGREEVLKKLSRIPGVYIPAFYDVSYSPSGTIKEINPGSGIKKQVRRQVVTDLENAFYPVDFIVPYMDIVHNRAVLEIARGCTGGCRFCAAGMTYRPVRERSKETLLKMADEILASTGFDEISLTSLSTVDHSQIKDLVSELAGRYEDKKISVSLSSLRVDSFSVELAREVQRVRKTGLTFAPEAGTPRLRNVINKGITEADLLQAVNNAFASGWTNIKLYFMIGLPTETKEDLQGIVDICHRIKKLGRKMAKGKNIRLHVSISTFIPKPFTPFQWVKMADKEEIRNKQSFLREKLRGRGLKVSWDDPDLSLLEGVFSRGDRKLAPVIVAAWKKGSRFDGWDEYFQPDNWEHAFQVQGIDPAGYFSGRDRNETLPWDHIKPGVSREFLLREYENSLAAEKTEDCRQGPCIECGVCSNLNTGKRILGDDSR